MTDRIAAGLAAAGLRPGARLALALANTHAGAFYRLLLGAYKAGVVPVPVNARLAPPETAHIVRDSARCASSRRGRARRARRPGSRPVRDLAG